MLGMIDIYNALEEDAACLAGILAKLEGFAGAVTVQAMPRGGMRIPFKDPRKYLVGRDLQIEHIAAEVHSQSASRTLVHGNSGAGKTVLAIAVAYALREEFPMQFFMEASSQATFRLELVRLARMHAKGLPPDAEEEQLVQAARQFLAESGGKLLLIVDDVTDAQEIVPLLPEDSEGDPVGCVLMTSTQGQPEVKSPPEMCIV